MTFPYGKVGVSLSLPIFSPQLPVSLSLSSLPWHNLLFKGEKRADTLPLQMIILGFFENGVDARDIVLDDSNVVVFVFRRTPPVFPS